MNDAEKKVLSGCYHDGVVYATGYELEDGEIELDNKLFTTFDSGIDGGVMAEINRLVASFNPSSDLRRFVVSLKLNEVMNDAGRDMCYHCDKNDSMEGETWCEDCLDDYCCGCSESWSDCDCDLEGGCMGDEPCDDDDEDDWCNNCEEYPEYCKCGCDDEDAEKQCDETQVSSLNAFDRARYLKSKE